MTAVGNKLLFVVSSGWREFDDSKVREISETCITTKAAYVLFYRRRPTPIPVSPASVPTGISASMPSATQTAAVPQAEHSHSETTASSDRKTVATPTPPAPAEFISQAWQTDMEAID